MIIMNTSDRKLNLKVKDGEKALSSKGLTDPRLFSGETEIHAVMDEETCLWKLKYSAGIPPPALQQRFTSFPRLFNFAKNYFERRNIELYE